MAAAGEPQRAKIGDPGGTHSGRLLLRMPEELHAELSRASKREGVSLNAFITSTLAGAVAWRDREAAPSPRAGRARERTTGPPPRRRNLELLLIANMAIVAAVGVLALVLLIRTLR